MSSGATGNTIGGTAAGAGNLISGNTGLGIELSSAPGNLIQGNFIGTNAAGTTALGNRIDAWRSTTTARMRATTPSPAT